MCNGSCRLYILFISMYLYRMSFKNCLLRLFFPNFMGMLCNKDADVKNLCVSGNVLCHRMKGGKNPGKVKYWMCEYKIVKSRDPTALIHIRDLMRREKGGKTLCSAVLTRVYSQWDYPEWVCCRYYHTLCTCVEDVALEQRPKVCVQSQAWIRFKGAAPDLCFFTSEIINCGFLSAFTQLLCKLSQDCITGIC